MSAQTPDPLHDPERTVYLAPDGTVYRRGHLYDPEQEGRAVIVYFSVLTLSGAQTQATGPLPEGSITIWRPDVAADPRERIRQLIRDGQIGEAQILASEFEGKRVSIGDMLLRYRWQA